MSQETCLGGEVNELTEAKPCDHGSAADFDSTNDESSPDGDAHDSPDCGSDPYQNGAAQMAHQAGVGEMYYAHVPYAYGATAWHHHPELIALNQQRAYYAANCRQMNSMPYSVFPNSWQRPIAGPISTCGWASQMYAYSAPGKARPKKTKTQLGAKIDNRRCLAAKPGSPLNKRGLPAGKAGRRPFSGVFGVCRQETRWTVVWRNDDNLVKRRAFNFFTSEEEARGLDEAKRFLRWVIQNDRKVNIRDGEGLSHEELCTPVSAADGTLGTDTCSQSMRTVQPIKSFDAEWLRAYYGVTSGSEELAAGGVHEEEEETCCSSAAQKPPKKCRRTRITRSRLDRHESDDEDSEWTADEGDDPDPGYGPDDEEWFAPISATKTSGHASSWGADEADYLVGGEGWQYTDALADSEFRFTPDVSGD